MVRKQTIEETDQIASKAIYELISLCHENQRHPQELLLCQQHGNIYDPKDRKSFGVGPGDDGLSSYTHLNFISNMANNFIIDDVNYFESLDDKGTVMLEHSIHLEKQLYLKIWENVYFIKLLTQFVRLARGEAYDWELKIPFQKGNTKSDHIRNEIKNKIEAKSELFHTLIADTYSQQIRNAIAHSQYYFIQGGIYYSNFKSDKFSRLEGMGFKDWESRFSRTLSLFFLFEKYLDEIHQKYAEKTLSQGNQIEIMVPLENDKFGFMLLEYFERGSRWIFKQ